MRVVPHSGSASWRRDLVRACALFLLAGAGLAAVPFEELVVDRVVDGSFESGFVSLTLPPAARVPLFASGWAARGTPVPTVVEDTSAWDGRHSLELRGEGTGPVQVVQDLPVAGAATALRVAFRAAQGAQVVRLLTAWGRGPTSDAEAALTLVVDPSGVEVRTPSGSWRLEAPLADGHWHHLEAIADPRAGVQTVALDGRITLSVPGLPTAAPRTLVLEAPGDRPSHFHWDALGLAPLPDLELQLLRSQALQRLDADAARWLLPRLEGAATALSRGQAVLAVPELRAARNQLIGGPGTAARELREGLDSLLTLLAMEQESRERRSRR